MDRTFLILTLFWVVGCTTDKPTTQPLSTRERQDAALKDPFGYKPDMGTNKVSGNGTFELDREGLKRDMDHVFNP